MAKSPAHVNHFLTKGAWQPTEPAKGNPPTVAPGSYNEFVKNWKAWANAGSRVRSGVTPAGGERLRPGS